MYIVVNFILFGENMRLSSLLLVSIAVCCICVSGCTTAHTNHQASSNELTDPTQQTSTQYPTLEKAAQKPTAAQNDFSQVSHARVSTISQNWDADAEDDGITVHPSLLDQYDETVKYSDVNIPVDIQIWTTKFDNNFKQQKDKLVYKGSGTITTWRDGNMFMNGGIKVPFSSMNVPSDETFGWTYVTIHTPDGKTYEAVDKFTALTP